MKILNFCIIPFILLCMSIELPARCVVQTGHQAAIWDLSYDISGKYVISAGHDHSIKFWKGNTLFREITGHGDSVTRVLPSPDGKYLISSGADRTIRFWDIATGKQAAVMQGARKYVNKISITDNGGYLLSSGGDSYVRLWDAGKRKLIRKTRVGRDEITVSEINRQGTFFAAIGYPEERVVLYRVGATSPLQTIPLGELEYFCFTADGAQLIMGDHNAKLVVWDIASRRFVGTIAQGEDSVSISKLTVSRDGRYLLAVRGNGTACLYDIPARSLVRSHSYDDAGAPNAVCFNPDGRSYSIATVGAGIYTYDLESGSDRLVSSPSGTTVDSSAYSPKRKSIAFLFKNCREAVLSLENGEMRVFPETEISMTNGAAFHPSGDYLYATGWQGVRKWSVGSDNRILWHARSEMSFDPEVSPDGKFLAFPEENNLITVLSAGTGEKVKALKGFRDLVAAVKFSPDGKYLAAGGMDRSIRLYRNGSFRTVKTRNGSHGRDLSDIAFHPGSGILASSSDDRTIRMWQVPSLKLTRTIRSGNSNIMKIVYSPDGALLAAGAGDGSVTVWDGKTGKRLHALDGINSDILNIFFIKNSKYLCAVGKYQYTRIWNLANGRWLDVRFIGNEGVIFHDSLHHYQASDDMKQYIRFFNGEDEDTGGLQSHYRPELLREFFQ